jgi:type IX secretion system PorP/SprF family membrane protein
MKRLLLSILFLSSLTVLRAQDIPLFSQKLTNSFIYNPAMAGHTFGSATFSYRYNYSGVQDGPKDYMLSLHSPFANSRFGVGFNIFQEEVGILKNTYYSGAFAYHLHFNKFSTLSMGVSGEYNKLTLNGATESYILSDPFIIKGMAGKPDFSSGLMFQNRFIKAGFAVNRLSSTWLQNKDTKTLTNFYSGSLQGMIPLRGGDDQLEPYFSFQKFSGSNNTYNVGLYYTYDNKILMGVAGRRVVATNLSGSASSSATNLYNFTLGYHLSKYLMVGYSRESILGGVGGFVGSTNELTLRYDFSDQTYKEKFKADYKSALSYRRKSLNTSGPKKGAGGRTPKQLNKAQKRVAAYSPNNRYQNTKKLSGGKRVPMKKPKYKSSSKKRKPVYKKRRR